MTSPVVELDNLKVKLGRREILRGISCRLGVSGVGKAIGLLGPNGAGKSTLILTLLGFHKPLARPAPVCWASIATARCARSGPASATCPKPIPSSPT